MKVTFRKFLLACLVGAVALYTGVEVALGQTPSSMFLAPPDARIMLFTPTDWMLSTSAYVSPEVIGGTVTVNLRKADGTVESQTATIQSVLCNPACAISVR